MSHPGGGRREQPLWVKVGLLGLPSRTSAWLFVWISVAVAVGCVAYGFVDRRYLLGVLMLGAA